MSNQLKETIADYGIENSLDAIIDLIEFRCLSELHKAAILAYLRQAKLCVIVLDGKQKIIEFTTVEMAHG
jgi:hypothetical protein